MLIKTSKHIQISTLKRGISSLELVFLEEYIMKQVNCAICGSKCVRYGKLKSGNQRWLYRSCKNVFTPKIDNDTKQLQQFLAWLFSKEVQSNMSGGGTGFRKALKKKWPKVKHQRCVFHVFSQVKRYTTSRANTLAGLELYALARDLFEVKSIEDSKIWVNRFTDWIVKHKHFLSEVTYDENGKPRPKHGRLIKAEKSILRLLNDNTLFTYLDEELRAEFKIPSTNNRIEGGVNACLREMQLYGASYIIQATIQFTGISHTHFLSYSPLFRM